MDEMITTQQFKQLIKATLFVSGDGIEIKEFADKFGYDLETVKKLVLELKQEMSDENGIHIIQFGGKIQLASNPDYAEQIALILNPIREKALTKAAMQTLGIIAYKQPITRLEIENIRGVSADYAVQVLLEHKMIEVVGRKDVIGKPLLFGTTEEFLKRFDLESVDNLPDYEELLDRIKLIKVENENAYNDSESLYKDFELSNEEEVPDFLINEEGITRLSSEEIASKKAAEEELFEKLKDIDKVIRSTREELREIAPTEKEVKQKEEKERLLKEKLEREEFDANNLVLQTDAAVQLLKEEIERDNSSKAEFETPFDNLTPETLEEIETQLDSALDENLQEIDEAK